MLPLRKRTASGCRGRSDKRESRMNLMDLTALALGEKIKKREVSSVEAVRDALARIREKEDELHAFLTVLPEQELQKQAEDVDRRLAAGEKLGALAGVPAAVKDNLCTKGIRTSCASRMLADFIPQYSAEAVQRLRAAGVIILGKTNMDEFAMGSTTETSAFGPTRNPVDLSRVPGGSSGGSAAAVAAGECSFALGTDTGGSVRQPAACCGVTGLKPTYGTVSRFGLIAYASSFDQIGPITRDTADAAAVLSLIAGRDPADATSLKRTEKEFSVKGGIKGKRIGIWEIGSEERVSPEIVSAVRAAAEKLRMAGGEIVEFRAQYTDYLVPVYYTIASAEAGSNLARFDGVKYGHRAAEYEGLWDMYCRTRAEGFGKEVKKRIMAGAYVLRSEYYDAYYRKAQELRRLIRKSYEEQFLKFDLIIMPTMPETAPALGSFLSDPLAMYSADCYTVPANLCGFPALTVPFGAGNDALPIGVQLLADRCRENLLLSAGYILEQP